MWVYYMAILLAVVSNVFYQVSQKLTPSNVNPILSLIVTYSTALFVCMIILPFYPAREGIMESFRKMNWASIVLGISIVGIETGFLFAYRAGWNISLAQLFATAMITLMLVPIGILFFNEKLSIINLAGIVLCFAGFVLLSFK